MADGLRPFASAGFYPNCEEAAGADRLVAAFGVDMYRRLAAVKARCDEHNVFRLNQNIQPATV